METGRKRNRRIRFWVDDAELAAIRQKMAEAGTVNMAAYLRKMAIDGRIILLDMAEIKNAGEPSQAHQRKCKSDRQASKRNRSRV